MCPPHPDLASFRTRESRSSRTNQVLSLNNRAAAPACVVPPPRPRSRRPKLPRHESRRRDAAKRLADQVETPRPLGGHPTKHLKLVRARSKAPTRSRTVSRVARFVQEMISSLEQGKSLSLNTPDCLFVHVPGDGRSRHRCHVLPLLPYTGDRVENGYLCLKLYTLS